MYTIPSCQLFLHQEHAAWPVDEVCTRFHMRVPMIICAHRYPEVDIFAVCQYLANALRGADSFDLLVLKEMVERNTGITVAVELSAEQVRGVMYTAALWHYRCLPVVFQRPPVRNLCLPIVCSQLEGKMGGELLSSYVLQHDADKMGKAWARGGRRMLQALQRGPRSEHLALPLFILVAQQRQAIMVCTAHVYSAHARARWQAGRSAYELTASIECTYRLYLVVCVCPTDPHSLQGRQVHDRSVRQVPRDLLTVPGVPTGARMVEHMNR